MAAVTSCENALYRAGKHNTNADALSQVSQEAARKSAKHRDDADTDDDEHSTHVAEMLASIADTTRLPRECSWDYWRTLFV